MNLRTLTEELDELRDYTAVVLDDDRELGATANQAFDVMAVTDVDPVGVVELRKQLALVRNVVVRRPVSVDLVEAKHNFIATARRLDTALYAFVEYFACRKS